MQRHSELPGAICFQLMVQREKKEEVRKNIWSLKNVKSFPLVPQKQQQQQQQQLMMMQKFDKQHAALLTAAWASLEAWAPACASARTDSLHRASPPGWVGPPARRTNSPDFRQKQTHIIAGGECFISHISFTGVAAETQVTFHIQSDSYTCAVMQKRSLYFLWRTWKLLIKPETRRTETRICILSLLSLTTNPRGAPAQTE